MTIRPIEAARSAGLHVPSLIWRLRAKFMQWRTAGRKRQGLAELLLLDDRLLQDIGVMRAEVRTALSKSDHQEAAEYLTCRRLSR